MSKKKKKKSWLKEPEDHDYPAAESYLTLLYDEEPAAKYAKTLSRAPMTSFAARQSQIRNGAGISPPRRLFSLQSCCRFPVPDLRRSRKSGAGLGLHKRNISIGNHTVGIDIFTEVRHCHACPYLSLGLSDVARVNKTICRIEDGVTSILLTFSSQARRLSVMRRIVFCDVWIG